MPELNNDDPSTLIKRSRELTTGLFLAALVLCGASLHLVTKVCLNWRFKMGIVCACSWRQTGLFFLTLGKCYHCSCGGASSQGSRAAQCCRVCACQPAPSRAQSMWAAFWLQQLFGCEQHSSCFCSAGKPVLSLLTPCFWGSVHIVFGADLNLYFPILQCCVYPGIQRPLQRQLRGLSHPVAVSGSPGLPRDVPPAVQVYSAHVPVPGLQISAGSEVCSLCSIILKQTSCISPCLSFGQTDAPVGPWTFITPASC